MDNSNYVAKTRYANWVAFYDTADKYSAYRCSLDSQKRQDIAGEGLLESFDIAVSRVERVTEILGERPVAFSITKRHRPMSGSQTVCYCDLREGDNYLRVPDDGYSAGFRDGSAKEKYLIDFDVYYQIRSVEDGEVLKNSFTLAEAEFDLKRFRKAMKECKVEIVKVVVGEKK